MAVAVAAAAAAGQAAAPRAYWLGPNYQLLPAGRHVENPSTPTFVYGKCLPAPDAGCVPPLQVQNWQLAKRHPSKFARPIKCVRGTIKRAPAAVFESTGGLEVYAGRTVVVIFARKTSDIIPAARALRAYPSERSAARLAAPPPSVGKTLRSRCRRGNLAKALEASG